MAFGMCINETAVDGFSDAQFQPFLYRSDPAIWADCVYYCGLRVSKRPFDGDQLRPQLDALGQTIPHRVRVRKA